ncbi:MAG: hypothetical protein ACJ74Z_11850 [Bryobacteraceae bacterium]
MSDEEKNQKAISELRDAFAPIAQGLTPEVEPATIYLPYVPVFDVSSWVGKPE